MQFFGAKRESMKDYKRPQIRNFLNCNLFYLKVTYDIISNSNLPISENTI